MAKKKRRHPDAELFAAREKVFRRFEALVEAHWSMANSYAESLDPELGYRLIASRRTILDLINSALPTPKILTPVDADEIDNPPAVH